MEVDRTTLRKVSNLAAKLLENIRRANTSSDEVRELRERLERFGVEVVTDDLRKSSEKVIDIFPLLSDPVLSIRKMTIEVLMTLAEEGKIEGETIPAAAHHLVTTYCREGEDPEVRACSFIALNNIGRYMVAPLRH